MRVGQKAHIEDQVGFLRNAIFVAEANGGNQQVFFATLRLKQPVDVRAQFVHIEIGRVDAARRRCYAAAPAISAPTGWSAGWCRCDPGDGDDGFLKTGAAAHRRRPREIADELKSFAGPCAGSSESDRDGEPSRTSTTSAARLVSGDCRIRSANAGIKSIGKIVDGVISQIFKCFERRQLSRARHSCQDDEFVLTQRSFGLGGAPGLGGGGDRPVRR